MVNNGTKIVGNENLANKNNSPINSETLEINRNQFSNTDGAMKKFEEFKFGAEIIGEKKVNQTEIN
jgi:hypothetical protein